MNCNYKAEKEKATASLSIYEINKQLVTQQPALIDYSEAFDKIDKYIRETNNEFYMLLCRDKNYYTLFVREDGFFNVPLKTELIECLKNFGEIKSIDFTEDEMAIEIWMTVPEDNDSYVMYLFNYDAGVIKCL